MRVDSEAFVRKFIKSIHEDLYYKSKEEDQAVREYYKLQDVLLGSNASLMLPYKLRMEMIKALDKIASDQNKHAEILGKLSKKVARLF